MLHLQSESTKPIAPEYIELENQLRSSPWKKGAFIAKEFNASEFQHVSTKNVTLRTFETSQRNRKQRDVPEIYELAPDVAYRCAQMSTDESNVSSLSFLLL